MYTIQNQTTGILKNVKEQTTFDHFDLCTTAIGSIPTQGLDIAGVTQRVTLLKKFEKKQKSVKLEDAEYKALVEAIKTCRWRVVHPDLVTFSELVNNTKPDKKS